MCIECFNINIPIWTFIVCILLFYARLFPNHVVLVWLYASFVQTSSFKIGLCAKQWYSINYVNHNNRHFSLPLCQSCLLHPLKVAR